MEPGVRFELTMGQNPRVYKTRPIDH